jgi:hypothetical protein
MSQLIRSIRWVLYLNAALAVWWFIIFLFGFFAGNLYKLGLSTFWLIIVLLLCTLLFLYGFKMLAVALMMLVPNISPDRKLGALIFTNVSVLCSVYLLYKIWFLPNQYTFKVVAITIVLSFIILQFLFRLLILYSVIREE